MTDVPTALLGHHDLQDLEVNDPSNHDMAFKRSLQTPACMACRERKIKCIPDDSDLTQCKFCAREKIRCVNRALHEIPQPGANEEQRPTSQYPDPSHLGVHAFTSGPYGPGNGASPFGSAGFSGRQLGLPALEQWRQASEDQIQGATPNVHTRNGAFAVTEESQSLQDRFSLIDGGAGQAAARKAAALAHHAANTRAHDAVGFRPEDYSWAVDIPGIDDGETEAEEEILSEDVPSRGGSTSGRGRGRGGKKKGWRAILKGTDHANIGKVPKNTISKRGRPSDRAKNQGRKRKKEVDPGPEFKRVMAKANNSFMEQDYETALDFVRQAVAANPEIWSAHSLLSQILESQGRHADAIEALRYGIPTTHEADNWQHLADLMTDKPEHELSDEVIEEAIWYLGRALSYRKPETAQWDIRIRKFHLYNMLQKRGQNNKNARLDAKSILRIWPTKTQFLKEFAVLCASWPDKGEQELAIQRYDEAFAYYMANCDKFGDEDDPTEDWEHLNIYLEMVELAGNPSTGVQKAKRIARWFLGRQKDAFWDGVTDNDCEWDIEDDRRQSVPEWMWAIGGPVSRDPAQYGAGMPIEIKVRLGKLRLKMGPEFREEALRHFSELLQLVDAVDDYRDTFEDVAQTLRKDDSLTEALKYFAPLRDCEEADHPLTGLSDDVWFWMGVCYQYTGKIQDAISCFDVIVQNRSNKHNHQLEATAKLAKLCEDAEELDRARFLCNDLIKISRHDLLIGEGVKMIPDEVRMKPVILPEPYRQLRKYVNPPIKPRLEPNMHFRQLLPAGPAPITLRDGRSIAPTPVPVLDGPVLGSSFMGGPASRAMELPPAMPEPFDPSRKSKRGRGKLVGKSKGHRSIVQAICGEVDGDGAANDSEDEEEDGRAPKRPRLRRKAKAPTQAEMNAHRRLQLMHDIQQRVMANFMDVQVHRAAMKAGDEEATDAFVEAALGMLDDFTDMRVFFPDRDKYLRLKEGDTARYNRHGKIPDDAKTPEKFLAIPFTDWHHTFSDLALVYARNAEQDKCYRILQDVLAGANVFYHNNRLKMTTYAVSFYCGLAFNDNQFIIDLARDLVKDSGDRGGEAYQVFAAVNRFAFGSNWFSAGPTQKWMLRMVKSHDYLAMPPEVRDRFDFSQQTPNLAKKSAELNGELQDLDAGVLLLYGHMVAVANHSFSALPYYYRALALDPDNICVNLSIATMWIQNSMKRQTNNRQYGIHQGLAFLFRYYDLRVASGLACHRQEAEFNVARMWHYLGLNHLAVPVYEKVLALSEHVQAEAWSEEGRREAGIKEMGDVVVVEDFAQEAAFALQGIYAVAGNSAAARRVTEEWLVI